MKPLRVALSLITADNDYQIEQANSAECVAQTMGINLEVVYAGGDTIEQSQQVLKFVQAKPGDRPDAIMFEPIGGPALAQAARVAVESGIGWAVLNKQVEYVGELRQLGKSPVFSVTNDHAEIGRIQGRQLGALLPDGGQILYIEGPALSDPSKLRSLGLRETRPANILIKTLRGLWTESSAFNAVKSWLRLSTSQHENLAAVAAQNDAMAVGARKAFHEFSRESGSSRGWEKLPFLGIDGVPKTGQAWVRGSVLAATIVTPPRAGPALERLARALHTGTIPPETTFIPSHSFPALSDIKPHSKKAAAAFSR